MGLIDRLTDFLSGIEGRKDSAASYTQDDPRVAAAALMFHVIDADGVRDEAEKDGIRQVLSKLYGADGKELLRLIEAGEEADRHAVDLYAFTRVIKREFDEERRREFIEVLWELVYADGERHELEDNIVWRIAELIAVERRDRIAMRQRVEARLGATGEGDA